MSTTEPLCRLIGIDPGTLSKEECILLEAELFSRICEELREFFSKRYREYFRLMKFTIDMESAMLEANFIRLVMKDILSTEEYTLEGIAHYVNVPADVVQDVLLGSNTCPSALLLRRTIELHRSVRSELYRSLMKKIAAGFVELVAV
jgi:hypothetical protein